MKRALVAILLAVLSCAACNASDKTRAAAADLVGNWEALALPRRARRSSSVSSAKGQDQCAGRQDCRQ